MDERIYIVKVRGIWRISDIDRFRERFQELLPGKVIVVDEFVDDIFELEPQDGQALVRMLAEEVLPEWRERQYLRQLREEGGGK